MTVDAPLLRALFDCLGAGMYAVDSGGRILASNPMTERLLGFPEAELVGREAHQTLHPVRPDGSPYPAAECELLAVLRDGKPAEAERDVFRTKAGGALPVSWIAAPVRVDGAVTGAVCVFYDATERLRAQRESERAYARLTLLNEVSQALSSTLDLPEALRRLARVVVPELADWCAVDLRAEDGAVERLAVVSRDPAGTEPTEHRDALGRVLNGAGPVFRPEAAPGGTAVVPLRARGGTLGAMTLVRLDPARALIGPDVLLAEELGRRAGLLIDNARLYAEQRRLVETFQRSLLTQPPPIGGLAIEVRYLPANEAAEVGGDWYDAFQLPDGLIAVAIGDVVGHDVDAAARMGQLRSILRAVAYQTGEPPAAVLGYVDRIVQGLDIADLATAVYGVLERAPDASYTFRWSSAGHPPPLLVAPGSAAELLPGGDGVLLGVWPDGERANTERRLPPRSVLVLYTDGLVENRHERLDTGLARLRLVATRLADRPLPEFCDELIERLVGGGTTDDVALIAIQVPDYGESGRSRVV